MEEIQMFLDEAESLMKKVITHLQAELLKIRAGKAMPGMLDGLMVEYYGTMTPLNQVASVNTPDARTLMIRPWEKGMVHEIEKSITNSNLGLNPQNDGEQVIINIPTLTEERRKALVKQVKHEGEQGKISIRNIRKDTNDSLKQLLKEGISEDDVKRGEEKVQAITDQYSTKIDEMLSKKEEEILTI